MNQFGVVVRLLLPPILLSTGVKQVVFALELVYVALSLEGSYHQLIDLVVGLLDLLSQHLLHFLVGLVLARLRSRYLWSLMLSFALLLRRWSLEMLGLCLLQQLIRWRWLWNVGLYSERDDAATYLHRLSHLWLELNVLLSQYKRSKFAEVVL